MLQQRRHIRALLARVLTPQHRRNATSQQQQQQRILPRRPRLDLKRLAADADAIAQNIKNRAVANVDVHQVADLYKLFGQQQHELDELRRERTRTAKQVSTTAEKQELIARGRSLKDAIQQLEASQASVEEQLYGLAVHIPNDTDPTSPVGSEDAARVVNVHGTPPSTPSPPWLQSHIDLAQRHDLVDFAAAANVSGASFYYLKNDAALLELALTMFAVQFAVREGGYSPLTTPDIVKASVAQACGFQPRDPRHTQSYTVSHHADDTCTSDSARVLAGTAEIPLAGMFASTILADAQLPARLVGVGKSFRAEAGARGADSRGLYRVHQFTKVELFSVVRPADSPRELDRILTLQQRMFAALGLSFRVLDMPTQELGASAYKKYDVEAWMPGRTAGGGWGEISSASNCTDYQARRLDIRYRPSASSGAPTTAGTSTAFVHTLNGTACAVPRMIIAILEQHQLMDGRVVVPDFQHDELRRLARVQLHPDRHQATIPLPPPPPPVSHRAPSATRQTVHDTSRPHHFVELEESLMGGSVSSSPRGRQRASPCRSCSSPTSAGHYHHQHHDDDEVSLQQAYSKRAEWKADLPVKHAKVWPVPDFVRPSPRRKPASTTAATWLDLPDSYFEGLRQYRAQHAALFHASRPASHDPRTGPPSGATESASTPHADTGDFYTSGYFYVTPELKIHRTRARPGHRSAHAEDNAVADGDEDDPPVKVTIPAAICSSAKPLRRMVPHRRCSFDDTASMSLQSHLHKGYEPIATLKTAGYKPGHRQWSLNSQLQHSEQKREAQLFDKLLVSTIDATSAPQQQQRHRGIGTDTTAYAYNNGVIGGNADVTTANLAFSTLLLGWFVVQLM
ncbi:Serine--tRNA ligase, mitochondrial [Sorochytrium milnesiophthora]